MWRAVAITLLALSCVSATQGEHDEYEFAPSLRPRFASKPTTVPQPAKPPAYTGGGMLNDKVKSAPPPPPPPSPPPSAPPPPPTPAPPPPVPILPSQVHISLGGDPTQMVVTFATPNTTLSSYSPVVKFGSTKGSYTHLAVGTTISKNFCYTEGSKIHTVTVTGLNAATKYYYVAGDVQVGLSKEFSFTTPPTMATTPLTFALFGDMGITNSNATTTALTNLDVDLMVHLGDAGYADDRVVNSNGTQFQDVLDEFFTQIEPIAANTPFMFLPGEHDASCEFTAYTKRIHVPFLASNSSTPLYYSFDYGGTHFVCLSTFFNATEVNEISPNSVQYEWLEKDLSGAKDAKSSGSINWIVVAGHYPMYCSYNWSACCNDSCKTNSSKDWTNGLRSNIEPLLKQYDVDLYFNGHTHNYERTLPVYDNSPSGQKNATVFSSPTHPIYVTVGTAGDIEPMENSWLGEPAWSAARHTTWNSEYSVPFADAGYGMLTVYNSTTLLFEYMLSENGTVVDSFTIIK